MNRKPPVLRLGIGLTACASLTLGAALLPACSEQDQTRLDVEQVPALGQLQLPLQAVSASNNVYRLRDATFVIQSPGGVVTEVSTEQDPDASEIALELEAGQYAVFLEPGFRMELLEGQGLSPLRRSLEAGRLRAERQRLARQRSVAVDAGIPDGGADTPPPSQDQQDVDAELVSQNPVFVTVEPGLSTTAVFTFQVGGDVVEIGTGQLRIVAEVIEGGGCSDPFEPNDLEPVPVTPPFQATTCAGDDDQYQLLPAAPEGELVQVDVQFSHAQGDIDAVLLNSNMEFVDFGDSVTDNEVLQGISNGEPFVLVAFLFSSLNATAVPYSVEMSLLGVPQPGNCCESSPVPGCSQPSVEACVCELDSFCCEQQFDDACVSVALQQCGGAAACTPPAENDCCTTSESGGCSDTSIVSCVCALDSQCCFNAYDDLCIEQAVAECGAQCGLPPAESDCCTASEAPGCSDAAVSDCVCGLDPACCVSGFDDNCVTLAASQCGASCGG